MSSKQIDAYRRMAQWIATRYRLVKLPAIKEQVDIEIGVEKALAGPIEAEVAATIADIAADVQGVNVGAFGASVGNVVSMICEQIDAPSVLTVGAAVRAKTELSADVKAAYAKTIRATFGKVVAALTVEMTSQELSDNAVVANVGPVTVAVDVAIQQVLACMFATDLVLGARIEADIAAAAAKTVQSQADVSMDLECAVSAPLVGEVSVQDNITFDVECIVSAIVSHLWGEYVDMTEYAFGQLIEKEVVTTQI